MRVLIVGNIAQNGYLLAKFLRSAGVEAFLVYDTTAPAHWLPEWEDCLFHPRDIERLSRGNVKRAGDVWTARLLEPWQRPTWCVGVSDCGGVGDPRWHPVLQRLAGGCDATILTGPWAAYGPYLSVPFVTFEHATMRHVPTRAAEGKTEAVALRRAYQEAAWNVITNADCRRAAVELGLTRYSFIPHPVDTDRFTPLAPWEFGKAYTDLKWSLTRGRTDRLIFLAPARQATKHAVWGTKNNGVIFEAFRRYLDSGAPPAQLVAAEYGDSVAEMRALVKTLKLSDNVTWYPLQPKRSLLQYYRAADVVLDQFDTSVGSYGTCTVEALAVGKPVITHINEALHEWTEVRLPPVLNHHTAEGIAGQLEEIAGEAWQRMAGDVGLVCRNWVQAHHSRQLVTDAYLGLLDRLEDATPYPPVNGHRAKSFSTAEREKFRAAAV